MTHYSERRLAAVAAVLVLTAVAGCEKRQAMLNAAAELERAAAGPTATETPRAAAAPISPRESAISAEMLRGESGGVMRLIRDEDPAAYDHLVEKLASARDVEAARRVGAEATVGFRRKLSPHAAALNDAEAQDLIRGYVAFGERHQGRPRMCSRYFARGVAGLTEAERARIAPELIEMGERQLQALIGAKRAGRAERARASEADWTEIGALWAASSRATPEAAAALNAKDGADPAFCGAMTGFLRTMLDARSPAAERVRLSFVANLLAS